MNSETNSSSWNTIADELAQQGYEISSCLVSNPKSILLAGRQNLIDREIAIKVLCTALDDSDIDFKRFQQETKVLASFDHPNIVKLFSTGRLQDGRPYLVMELVRGATLEMLLRKQGALAESLVLEYAAQICDALTYAHSKQIIHRDLKPANIMVENHADCSVIKLIDFGVLKNTAAGSQQLTAAGAVLPGTANYMSPEQCRNAVIDSRSDIYSLGCVLYELCTGQAPMTAESDWLILSNHLNKEVEFPSGFAISRILKATILRCLAKKPEDRWALAVDLKNALLAPPVKVPQVTKRNIALGALLLLLLLLLLGLPKIFSSLKTQFSTMSASANSNDTKLQSDLAKTYAEFYKLYGKTSSSSHWHELCGLWLKQHVHDSDWLSVTYCVAELNSKDSPAIAEAISKLHDRISMLLRHKLAQSTEAVQSDICNLFSAKLQTEVSMNDWTSVKVTLEEAFSKLRDQSFKELLLEKIVAAYFKENMLDETTDVLHKYGQFSSRADVCATIFAEVAQKQFDNGQIAKAETSCHYATQDYLIADKIADLDVYGLFLHMLLDRKKYNDLKDLIRRHPASSLTAGPAQSRCCVVYVRTMLACKQVSQAEALLKTMSRQTTQNALAQTQFDIEDELLGVALAKVDRKQIEEQARVVLNQFTEDQKSNMLPAYSFLLLAWLADSKLAEDNLKYLSTIKIHRHIELGCLYTEYGNHLRYRKTPKDAVRILQLAHREFDLSGTFYHGRMTTFVAETECYMAMNDFDSAEACISRAEEYIRKYNVEFEKAASIYLVKAKELRLSKNYDAAIALDKDIYAKLSSVSSEMPWQYAQLVYDLAEGYRCNGQKKEGLQVIDENLPRCDKQDPYIIPIVKEILEVKKLLLKMPDQK